jgi:hypothetical protein
VLLKKWTCCRIWWRKEPCAHAFCTIGLCVWHADKWRKSAFQILVAPRMQKMPKNARMKLGVSFLHRPTNALGMVSGIGMTLWTRLQHVLGFWFIVVFVFFVAAAAVVTPVHSALLLRHARGPPDPPPFCDGCNQKFSVRHHALECKKTVSSSHVTMRSETN